MSDVISVRIPRELKEKMRKYSVDWSREIREFLEERIRALEFIEMLDGIEERARKRRTRVDSARLIREAREER
ncbi:MAG: antitoxin [Desulfurococcales archaeon]|nr:antitoxin [Desulfurococcales archaeon]